MMDFEHKSVLLEETIEELNVREGKIYIDGIYDIVDINEEDIKDLIERLNALSEYSKSDIYLGLDWKKEDVPQTGQAEIIELKLED